MSKPTDLAEIYAQLSKQQTLLVDLYYQTLRETMFTNRALVQPAALKHIAAAEAAAVLQFFQSPAPPRAQQRGTELCRLGLGEEALFRLTYVTADFMRSSQREDLRPLAMSTLETYQKGLVVSFIQTRKAIVLEEQEHISGALERALHRYTVQLEVAASVARAATSILDLDELLNTMVELISDRFRFDYVGIFLLERDEQWATLRAGTSAAAAALAWRNRRIEMGDESLIGQCLAQGEVQVILDVDEAARERDAFFLPGINAAAAIPLLSHGEVIGALMAQTRSVTAFADKDLTVLRILADQLTNAIQNSRLFAELSVERKALERSNRELEKSRNDLAALYAKEQEHSRELERTFAELRRAEGLRDDLTNMIVHDLRSPLTAIIANIDLLNRLLNDPAYAGELPRFLTGAHSAAPSCAVGAKSPFLACACQVGRAIETMRSRSR